MSMCKYISVCFGYCVPIPEWCVTLGHSPAASNCNPLQLSADKTPRLVSLVTAMAPVEIATIAENAHGSAFEVTELLRAVGNLVGQIVVTIHSLIYTFKRCFSIYHLSIYSIITYLSHLFI